MRVRDKMAEARAAHCYWALRAAGWRSTLIPVSLQLKRGTGLNGSHAYRTNCTSNMK